MYNELGRRGTRVGYWWERQKDRGYLETPGAGVWIILKLIVDKMGLCALS
jgi:hypothetical protein